MSEENASNLRDEVAEVSFPSGCPRDQCLDAVEAARKYIHQQGHASREEIITELVPEEQYPIGVNGLLAQVKGVTPTFREWWWENIVEPGLQKLADVQRRPGKSENWVSTKSGRDDT